MRKHLSPISLIFLAAIAGCSSVATPQLQRPAIAPEESAAPEAKPVETGVIEAAGKTQPVPGRVAKIAPSALHPVTEVRVAPGDRVKAGQPLVKLEDHEAQAEMRAKEAALAEMKAALARLRAEPRQEEQDEARAALESCCVSSQEARRLFEGLEALWLKGSIPEQRYHEARATLAKCEADKRAAELRLQRLLKRPFPHEIAEAEARVAAADAELDAAQEELEHYTTTAAIDGVVSFLNVSLGSVDRPGTTTWGEIVDLREIDVRCDLTPQQADQLFVGQSAEVFSESEAKEPWKGKIVRIGIAADPVTGRVPVIVRLDNPKERLRCNVAVAVKFRRTP